MDWNIFILLVFVDIIPMEARHDMKVKRLIDILRRRNYRKSSPILGIPRYPEDLPPAEPMLPGHTLLKPTSNSLKSAVKYPQRDVGDARVYGNLDHIGISGYRGERVKYTSFRKTNDILDLFRKIVDENSDDIETLPSNRKEKKYTVILIKPYPPVSDETSFYHSHRPNINQLSEEENTANEILDDSEEVSEEGTRAQYNMRRSSKKSSSKFRHRKRIYSDSKGSSESSGSSDYEKNPGNPYTLHKNKYLQNWMWNHFMDGNHMNINPYAPDTPEMGPSGIDLFFSRKWWYYNQDDYKPLA